MTSDTTSTDPLVDVLATRLRLIDLVAWRHIATWAEESELSFEDLRLLLALAAKTEEAAASVSELAELAGLALEAAYPATRSLHRRGYLLEQRRLYSLTEHGQDLLAKLDAARRVGIQAYVETLSREERERVLNAFVDPR